MCKWEVEEAARCAKRFVPIVCRALEGVRPDDLLCDLNYFHFYAETDVPGSGFGTGLMRLIEVLKVDRLAFANLEAILCHSEMLRVRTFEKCARVVGPSAPMELFSRSPTVEIPS